MTKGDSQSEEQKPWGFKVTLAGYRVATAGWLSYKAPSYNSASWVEPGDTAGRECSIICDL